MAIAGLAASAGPSRAGPPAELNVFVLYAHSRLLPADVEIDAGLREALRKADGPVQVFDEFLDITRFGSKEVEDGFVAFLRQKYATRPPTVLVAAGSEALRFLLTHRKELFSEEAIVHEGVFLSDLRSVPDLPPDVIGVPVQDDYSPTLECALRLHPRASRLVIVTGASPWDLRQERLIRQAARRLEGRVGVEFLAGLPLDSLRTRLAALGPEAVVFTVGFFRDGAGREFNPREAVQAMASVASAPVYAPFNTFLGTGVVGGYMPQWTEMGRQAGELVLAVLRAPDPAALRASLPASSPMALHVDWRQAVRWGIAGAVPRDAVVHFREPTFLEQHGGKVSAAAIAFLLQTALVAGLLIERRRRRAGQRAIHRQQVQLAHVSRVAVAGELSGSLAHQLNQPLGAILANAEAGELLLAAGAPRLEELKGILADIRKDDLRASEVIQRLRQLLARQEVSLGPLDLPGLLKEAEAVLAPEARRRRVTLAFEETPPQIAVRGDRLQLQQVLINLVLNAMEAVADLPEDRRTIRVSVEQDGEEAFVAVRDRGPGISEENLPRVFDSFFTTKPKGLGLGLSIARTLVENMGGSVRAESQPGEGATFRIRLPLEVDGPRAAGGVR